jgi:hypothetical protein
VRDLRDSFFQSIEVYLRRLAKNRDTIQFRPGVYKARLWGESRSDNGDNVKSVFADAEISGIALYGPGVHDAILLELELGERVALAIDTEDCYGADSVLYDYFCSWTSTGNVNLRVSSNG